MNNNPTPTAPILVTGGTGKTGHRVTDLLRRAGQPVRVAARSTDPALDWTDQATWRAVLADVEVAYLCYSPDLSFPGAAEAMGAFARIAVDAGVRRAVLLSGRGEPLAQDAEAAVAATGIDLTVLRSSFLAQNFSEDFLVEGVRHGRVSLPASGRFGEGIIDADDVAEAAVAVLLNDIPGQRTFELSGPRLLDFEEVVSIISGAAGHPVVFDAVTPDAYLAELEGAGLPAPLATLYTELFVSLLDGRNATLTDCVQQLLGRQPRDFADVAQQAAGTGVWTRVTA